MYTFENLSPLEFTELFRDLFKAQEQIDLSVTPEGRDGGIDIVRYGESSHPEIVVQCKHYKRTPKAQLIRNLKDELKKVEKIRPKRYVIAVSQPLTVENKRILAQHFHPYLRSADDILATDDINGLLRENPQIELQHYKLWLQSAAVLRHILSGTGVWKSQLSREIEDRIKVYVQTPAFNIALDILKTKRMVVISGSPGVGKSTLAQMLVAKHLESGFTYHEIESFNDDPREIPPDGNVILYFDDFLGRSVWRDNASPETEKRLEKWIDLVQRHTRLRLILTTRSYLLESARRYSDVGSNKLLKVDGVELQLADFNKSTRARILYNHLYFNAVSSAHCRSLAGTGILQKILNHPNFVPRIIESISTAANWPRSLTEQEYANHILSTLDKPDEIYLPTIQDRISQQAKELLFILGTWITENPTIEAIKLEHRTLLQDSGKVVMANRDFESAMKELAGSLVEIYQHHDKKERCRFLNPGVSDSTRKAMWAEIEYWEKLVRASKSGLQLYPLALCAPDIGNFPGDTRELNLPDIWYQQWIKIAASKHTNSAEFLEGIGECLSLNIWSENSNIIMEALDLLHNRYQDVSDYEVEWSLLAVRNPRAQVISTLEQLPWFSSAFKESIRIAIDDLGFYEANQRFDNLTELGAFGMSGWEVMQGKAEEYIYDAMSDTHRSPSNEYRLYDDEWEELDGLIKEYQLDHLQKSLNDVPAEPRPSIKTSTTVKSNTTGPGDLTDEEILTMFASLAEIPSSQLRRSLSGPPF